MTDAEVINILATTMEAVIETHQMETDQVQSYLATTLGFVLGQTTLDKDLQPKLDLIVYQINSGISQSDRPEPFQLKLVKH